MFVVRWAPKVNMCKQIAFFTLKIIEVWFLQNKCHSWCQNNKQDIVWQIFSENFYAEIHNYQFC